jgi:hypothetical protein
MPKGQGGAEDGADELCPFLLAQFMRYTRAKCSLPKGLIDADSRGSYL